MVVGLAEVASEFEFGTYLIRAQGIDRSYYDTAWTLAVLRRGLVAVALAASASAVADFFAEPRLQHVLYALALASQSRADRRHPAVFEMGAGAQPAQFRSPSRLCVRDRQNPQSGVRRLVFARARGIGNGDLRARRSDRSRDVARALRAGKGPGCDATYVLRGARNDRHACVAARRRHRAHRGSVGAGRDGEELGGRDP